MGAPMQIGMAGFTKTRGETTSGSENRLNHSLLAATCIQSPAWGLHYLWWFWEGGRDLALERLLPRPGLVWLWFSLFVLEAKIWQAGCQQAQLMSLTQFIWDQFFLFEDETEPTYFWSFRSFSDPWQCSGQHQHTWDSVRLFLWVSRSPKDIFINVRLRGPLTS